MKGVHLHAVHTPADWAHLEQLLREYAARDLDQAHLSTIWKDLLDLPVRYGAAGGAAVLLRNAASEPAWACGAYAPTRVAGTCEIKRIYVQPAHRRQGHGQRIIRELLQRAAQAGYTHAALSTWRNNAHGLALYAALGFAPVAPFKDHPNPDLLYLGLALPSTNSL
jgi:putative acetyltransferase